jgi:hypothetical protein
MQCLTAEQEALNWEVLSRTIHLRKLTAQLRHTL